MPHSNWTDEHVRLSLRIPLVCAWLLIFAALSPTGRGDTPNSVGSMDVLAVSKLATRVISLSVFSYVIARLWHQPKRKAVVHVLLPFGTFVAWGLISTLWSPLFAVSLGQAMTMLMLVLLAVAVGLCWTETRDTSTVLCSLPMALLLYSLLMLLSYMIFPGAGDGRFALALAHPDTASKTASLGLVILLAARLLWGWRWSSLLLVPGGVMHCAVLFMAIDRTAIGLAVILSFFVLCVFGNRAWLAVACLTLSAAGVIYMALDPGLQLVGTGVEGVVGYLGRDQTVDQLAAFSGRSELWETMWQSAMESLWIGHGYFVTSSTGVLDIWGRSENFTAHNAFFQVFVTTGVVGVVLFMWALWRPGWLALRSIRGDDTIRTMAIFGSLVAIWGFGWGLLGPGIVGQTIPTTVVFFAVLGLVAGQLAPAAAGRTTALPGLKPSSEASA